jgi:DNA-binding NtrC family response regulator
MATDVCTLSNEDRILFRHVTAASLANPFGEERPRLDREIAGPLRGANGNHALAGALARVGERIGSLEAEEAADPGAYAPADRDLLSRALLFDTFHRHLDDFDRLIEEQTRAGDSSCPVPFASEALALLARRGFSADEARRHFALFYQLRRAYFFIDQALVGRSPSLRALRERLWRNVFTDDLRRYWDHLWDRMEDFSTLLLGETGTGKGAAAAAIGRSGFIPFDAQRGAFAESFARSFVAINLSQYPESLIESELFGHRKGAFTGAIDHHEGVFARCSPHGAIFLDEVGEVSAPIQIKLLQVLQERTFSAVGSHEKQRFAGRVIAATNRPLDELRRKGHFRDDFYYRLCSDVVVVPPLRQRLDEDPGELDLLLTHLVGRLAGEPVPAIVAEVKASLEAGLPRAYGWPGNVRELEQAVRRILLGYDYTGDRTPAVAGPREELLSGMEAGALDAPGLLRRYCHLLYERHGTYEEVARKTGLDRRTVRKYILAAQAEAVEA